MLLFSFRFYGVRSDIGVLGFFPLICIHAIEFRYRRTDVSDSLSILQERNNRSRAAQGDRFNVRWCIFSVFFLIFNLRNQVFVFLYHFERNKPFQAVPLR